MRTSLLFILAINLILLSACTGGTTITNTITQTKTETQRAQEITTTIITTQPAQTVTDTITSTVTTTNTTATTETITTTATTTVTTTTTSTIMVSEIICQSPISNERFVKGETIEFKATTISDQIVDGSQLQWVSDIYGNIGSGLELDINQLPVGTHMIEVSGYGKTISFPIRVFNDLWGLYQSPPSQGEIDRIMNDFSFVWVDGDTEDEKWETYDSWLFDQTSTDPSKLAIISKLDVLRHQRFSEPLPFSDGATAYDHLKTYVNSMTLYLDCRYNSGGGGNINLNRGLSVWDGRMSGTPDNPDACKTPFENPTLYKYISPLYLLIHEGRHSEPGAPPHTTCAAWSDVNQTVIGGMDQQLEGGGGYAQAALYCMWVYKYGLYDPLFMKEEAKTLALMFLNGRFCSKPEHSNPKVQAIIDELLS